jgi:hypothetical protein
MYTPVSLLTKTDFHASNRRSLLFDLSSKIPEIRQPIHEVLQYYTVYVFYRVYLPAGAHCPGCVPACRFGAKEVQNVCLPAGAKGVCLPQVLRRYSMCAYLQVPRVCACLRC